jgi:hemoglobin
MMTLKSALADRARAVAEQPLNHAGVDRASIGKLVREFYAKVRSDGRLERDEIYGSRGIPKSAMI